MTNNHEPWAQWISDESITKLYAEGIKRWGGSGSAPKIGCVDAALGAAYNAELYSPQIEEEGAVEGLIFACYLLFYLSTKHCYIDGNKRISWACMTFVLLNFGLTIEANDDDAEAFCLRIANGEIDSGADVISWVYPRLMSVI
jgi:death on curing protein